MPWEFKGHALGVQRACPLNATGSPLNAIFSFVNAHGLSVNAIFTCEKPQDISLKPENSLKSSQIRYGVPCKLMKNKSISAPLRLCGLILLLALAIAAQTKIPAPRDV